MGFFGRKQQSKSAVRLTTITTSADLAARIAAADSEVTQLSATRQATVFACIQVRGEGFAQLSPKVYEVVRPQDATPETAVQTDRREAREHWAWRLWREGPARDWTPFEYQERISNDLDTRGNHFAYKVKTGERITELVPLPFEDVDAKINREARRIEYTVRDFSARGRRTFTRDDIFHVRRMTRDGVLGLSPIDECRLTIGTVISAETHGRATFTNGAHPSGVVEYPETMDDTEYSRLQDDFDRNWNGERAGRTLILEGGAKFVPIAISNREAQFLETRQFGRGEICGIYRVPPHMIGDLSRSTNNNIEHQGIEWVQYGLLPSARRTESAWNTMPEMRGTPFYLEFNIDALIRGDFKSRMDGYGRAIERGILTPNEARAKENLPAHTDGGRLMMMANVTSLTRAIEGGSASIVEPQADNDTATEGEDDGI